MARATFQSTKELKHGMINLKFPLRKFRKGFFEGNYTTLDAVREDIKILLLTRKGERVINPHIGTNISGLAGELFNQINKTEMSLKITNEIKAAFEQWMPHVVLLKVDILTHEDDPALTETQITIRLRYRLRDAEALTDSIQLNINA